MRYVDKLGQNHVYPLLWELRNRGSLVDFELMKGPCLPLASCTQRGTRPHSRGSPSFRYTSDDIHPSNGWHPSIHKIRVSLIRTGALIASRHSMLSPISWQSGESFKVYQRQRERQSTESLQLTPLTQISTSPENHVLHLQHFLSINQLNI